MRTIPGAITMRRTLVVAGCSITALSSSVARAGAQEQREEVIRPSRPVVANAAEVQRPGMLQLEIGGDSYFRSDEFHDRETMPTTLRIALTDRALLSLDWDAIESEDEPSQRASGTGDVRTGAQLVLAKHDGVKPALAIAYQVKAPTAKTGLGTGKVDHRAILLVSEKLGGADLDFNAAYLNVGREASDRRGSGAQAALAVSREAEDRGFGAQWELAWQSEEAVEPRGAFALGALTYRIDSHTRLDAGARAGVGTGVPRWSAFGGITAGIVQLWRAR
jgi:hypothetical protein